VEGRAIFYYFEKKNEMKAILTFTLLFTSALISAQTVEEFIAMAVKNDPHLRAERLAYEAAKLEVDQVGFWPDPSANLSLGALPIETRNGPQRFRLGIRQSIPWRGKLQAAKDVQKAKALTQSENEALAAIDLEYSLRVQYSSLLFHHRRLEIVSEQISLLSSYQELAKSAVSSNTGSLRDVLLIEREAEALDGDQELIKKEIELARMQVNLISGRPLELEINVAKSPSAPILASASYTSFQHPRLSILDQRVRLADSRISQSKIEMKPTFSVGLDYGYIGRRSDVDFQGNGRDILMPMGSIRIPISKKRYQSAQKQEEVVKSVIAEEKLAVQKIFQSEIESALLRIEYSRQVVAKYQKLREISETTLTLMKKEYAASEIDLREILEIELSTYNYDLQVAKAIFDEDVARAILNKYKK